MEKFKKIEAGIQGVIIIEPRVYEDTRGFFMESYNRKDFKSLGIEEEFLQDNHSKSHRGVLRGLHFQKNFPQGKLVRVTRGAVLDIVVDLRSGSKTFGRYVSIEINDKNKRMLYIPKGLAHGFLTLEDDTEFQYKCTNYYNPLDEGGIIWNDKTLNIDWKLDEYKIDIDEIELSIKDKSHGTFKEYISESNYKKKEGEEDRD